VTFSRSVRELDIESIRYLIIVTVILYVSSMTLSDCNNAALYVFVLQIGSNRVRPTHFFSERLRDPATCTSSLNISSTALRVFSPPPASSSSPLFLRVYRHVTTGPPTVLFSHKVDDHFSHETERNVVAITTTL
jgi:hypothetical protein